jgi:hypothetical protein
MRRDHSRTLAGPALAAVLTLAGGGLSACGGLDDDNPEAPFDPVELPDIRGADDIDDAYSGLLDAAFREDLDAYEGIEVTLLADVSEVLSPRAFTVTSPEDAEVEPVLVIATVDAGDVEPRAGEPLLIAATPVKDFDAEVVAEEMRLDVNAGQLEEWDDEAFLVATILEPGP